MLGSLPQFFSYTHKRKVGLQSSFIQEPQQDIDQPMEDSRLNRKRYKSTLHYETADKSSLLQKIKRKKKSLTQANHELLSWAFHANMPQQHAPKKHWVERDVINKNKLGDKNKLLKAIVKTKQLQQQDHTRTLFQKSIDRVLFGFSKVKTLPINSLLPASCFKEKVTSPSIHQPVMQSLNQRMSTQMPDSKLLELEKSIKWAKKHKKNFNSFYQQLGKSVEVVQRQTPAKNNYELQRQESSKREQQWRRKGRQQFLRQIQKRVREYQGK